MLREKGFVKSLVCDGAIVLGRGCVIAVTQRPRRDKASKEKRINEECEQLGSPERCPHHRCTLSIKSDARDSKDEERLSWKQPKERVCGNFPSAGSRICAAECRGGVDPLLGGTGRTHWRDPTV